jgi:hypothetical protein
MLSDGEHMFVMTRFVVAKVCHYQLRDRELGRDHRQSLEAATPAEGGSCRPGPTVGLAVRP